MTKHTHEPDVVLHIEGIIKEIDEPYVVDGKVLSEKTGSVMCRICGQCDPRDFAQVLAVLCREYLLYVPDNRKEEAEHILVESFNEYIVHDERSRRVELGGDANETDAKVSP